MIYLVLQSFGGSNLNLRTSKEVKSFRPQCNCRLQLKGVVFLTFLIFFIKSTYIYMIVNRCLLNFIEFNQINEYQFNINSIPKHIKIYTNIYKYIQDIQDIYKIPGGGQAAAARPGPEARVPVRPPPPGRRLVFCIYLLYLVYICIYLYIF